jgi:hypothetical protein
MSIINLAEGIADKSLLQQITPENPPVTEEQVTETAPTTDQAPVTEQAPVETPPVIQQPTGLSVDEVKGWLASQNIEYEIQGEEDLKNAFSSLKEFESVKKQHDELQNSYNVIVDEFKKFVEANDPIKQFGSADAYKAELTAKALAKGSTNEGVVYAANRIARSDLNTMENLDVVSLGWQYDSPKFAGKDDIVKKSILKELGVDDDILMEAGRAEDIELTPEQELKLSRLAVNEKDRFNTVKSKVEIPAQNDFNNIINQRNDQLKAAQERLESLKTGWTTEANRIADLVKTIQITDKDEKGEEIVDFTFEVDSEFKKGIPKMVVDYALQNNIEPTQENAKAIAELVGGIYQLQNREKIFRAYKKEVLSKIREQVGKDQYNGRPINTQEAPPDRKPTEADLANIAVKNFLGIK